MRGRAGDSDTFHARNANTHPWRGSTADDERPQPFGTVSSTEPSGSRRITAPAVASDGAGVPGIAIGKSPNGPAPAKVIRKSHSHAELEMLQRPRPPPLPPPPSRPRPARAARSWLKFSIDGESSTITAEKHKIVHQLGVQMRDLRILDPKLANTYPSGLLCREQALVVNLEHIKCIVTTTFVLVLNADEENVASFVEELRKRLSTLRATTSFPVLAEAERFRQQRMQRRNEAMPAAATADEMPFELRVLEVCLEQERAPCTNPYRSLHLSDKAADMWPCQAESRGRWHLASRWLQL